MRRGSANLIGGCLAFWVAVIVISAGERPDASTWIGTNGVDAVIVGCGCIGLVVVLAYMLSGRYSWSPPDRSQRSVWTQLATFALLGLALLVWNSVGPNLDLTQAETPIEEVLEAVAPDLEPEPDEPAAQPVVELRDLLVLAIVAVGAAVGVASVRAMRKADLEADISRGAEAQQYETALRSARARLGEGDDPRAAVLHAYAELEATLADLGLARIESDTVPEHQVRVLAAFDLDQRPFRVLADLYETARFSSTAIGVTERDRARAALDDALGLIGEST